MKKLAVFDNVSLELLAVFQVEVVLEKLFSFDSVFVKTFPCCEVAFQVVRGIKYCSQNSVFIYKGKLPTV